MYTYIVKRTQIYLSEQQDRELQRRATKSGRTKSDLIREAIDAAHLRGAAGGGLSETIVQTFGAWSRGQSGERSVERLRAGRLAKLHRKK